MPFSLGGSKNKTNSSSQSNTNTSSTTNPIIPSYIQGPATSYYNSLNNLMSQYMPGSSSAGMSQSTAPGGLFASGGYNPQQSTSPAMQMANTAIQAAQQQNPGLFTGGVGPSSGLTPLPAPQTVAPPVTQAPVATNQPGIGQSLGQIIQNDPSAQAMLAASAAQPHSTGPLGSAATSPTANALQQNPTAPGGPSMSGQSAALPVEMHTNTDYLPGYGPNGPISRPTINTGNVPAASATPAQPFDQWAAYGAQYPDVAKEAQRVVADGEFPNADAYYQWHYQHYGQADGRTVPTTSSTSSSATPAAAATPTQNLIPGYSPVQTAAYQNAMNLGGNQAYFQGGAMLGLMGGLAPANTATGATVDPTTGVADTRVGNAAQMANVNLDPAAQFGGATLAPTSTSDQVNLGPTALYNSSSMLNNLGNYMNPYTNSVVASTLGLNDVQNAKDRAALAAQGAMSGAFGGSRFGIAQGNLAQQQQLANANIASGLFNTAYNQATTNSNLDADRSQQANAANAGALNTQNLQQGNMNLQNNQFNSGAINARNATQANMYQQAGLSNQDAINQRNLAQGTLNYNVGNTNAGAQNSVIAQQAQISAAKAQADAAAANARAQQQAQLQQQAGQFNAQQQDAANARALQAASLMGSLGMASGNSANQDIATQLAAGNNDRATQFDINSAPLQQAAAIQALLGINPGSLFGQTSVGNTNGTNKGTSTGLGVSAGYTG